MVYICFCCSVNITSQVEKLSMYTRILEFRLPMTHFFCVFYVHIWSNRYNNNNNNNNNNNKNDNNKCNRTLIVGPSVCGKTHLLLNKLRLIRLEDPEKQIRFITRSPEQYEDVELHIEQGIEVEENVGDLEEYRGCCVVFDDMLDSNQNMIDPFFTRGRHKSCDVFFMSELF